MDAAFTLSVGHVSFSGPGQEKERLGRQLAFAKMICCRTLSIMHKRETKRNRS